MRGRAFFGILLIVLGGLWLLAQTGYVNWLQVLDLLRFWPLLLIAFGVGLLFPRTSWVMPVVLVVLLLAAGIYMVTNPIPTSNDLVDATLQAGPTGAQGLTELVTEVDFTAGELRISGGAEHAADLQARYHERLGKPELTYTEDNGRGTVRLDYPRRDVSRPSEWFNWPGMNNGHDTLDLTLNSSPVHSVDVKFTAGTGVLDFDGLAVSMLRLDMTAGDVEVRLGLPKAGVTSTEARLEMTAGKLELQLPSEAGVHLVLDKTAGSTNVDGLGWRQEGDDYYSPNYDSAAYRIELNVDITAGQFDINMR